MEATAMLEKILSTTFNKACVLGLHLYLSPENPDLLGRPESKYLLEKKFGALCKNRVEMAIVMFMLSILDKDIKAVIEADMIDIHLDGWIKAHKAQLQQMSFNPCELDYLHQATLKGTLKAPELLDYVSKQTGSYFMIQIKLSNLLRLRKAQDEIHLSRKD